MAVPVVGEAGFDLEVLAGEAEIEGLGAGDRVGLAPGLVAGLHTVCLGCVRHSDRTAEMVGVNHVKKGGLGHGQWQVRWLAPGSSPGAGSARLAAASQM